MDKENMKGYILARVGTLTTHRNDLERKDYELYKLDIKLLDGQITAYNDIYMKLFD